MAKKEKLPPEIYFAQLPRCFTSAGGVILNDKNEMLIVKPSYRDHWEIPGGMTDRVENLRETVMREIKEELNIDVTVKGILCLDFKSPKDPVPGSVQSLLEIEPLTSDQIAAIRIDNDEIIDYGYFPLEKVYQMLIPILAPRLRQAIKARENKTVFYLENGENPFGKAA